MGLSVTHGLIELFKRGILSRRVRSFALGVVCSLAVVVGVRVFGDVRPYFGRRIDDRARLVQGVVRENAEQLKRAVETFSGNNPRAWLISRAMAGEDPRVILRKVRHHVVAVNPSSRELMSRWENALIRWAETAEDGHQQGVQELLALGRKIHIEAEGYKNVGLGLDASVLYLWSNSLIQKFIERSPADPGLPEALFLLGEGYLRLRHGFPPQIRSDRILNLCPEFFPESIWAKQAVQLRRSELLVHSQLGANLI